MRDSVEFRDEVYRRADRRRRQARRRLGTALCCAALALAVTTAVHTLSPLVGNLVSKDSADKFYTTTDTPEAKEEGSGLVMCYVFELDGSHEFPAMPFAIGFDDRDNATEYFCSMTANKESVFDNCGFNEKYFADSGIIFVVTQGKPDDRSVRVIERDDAVEIEIKTGLDNSVGIQNLLVIATPRLSDREIIIKEEFI